MYLFKYCYAKSNRPNIVHMKTISKNYKKKGHEYERDRKRKHNESKRNKSLCVYKYIEHLPNKKKQQQACG